MPAGVSYKRRMHFLLQRRARCGRRCIGAGEELIRAFLASPFSLPRCHGSPPSLPIYLPSVVSLFLCLFFSRRNFLIFKFETFIRIIIVFICQLVISLSLLSLPPPLLIFIRRECRRKCAEGNESPRFYYSILFLTHRLSPMKVVPKIVPFSIITHIGLIIMRKRTLFCNISYIFGRKLKKRTFQESNVYRQSYGDSFGNTIHYRIIL